MEPFFFVENPTGADLFRLRFLANRWHSEHVSGHPKLGEHKIIAPAVVNLYQE